jgi:hypothetical protein
VPAPPAPAPRSRHPARSWPAHTPLSSPSQSQRLTSQRAGKPRREGHRGTCSL